VPAGPDGQGKNSPKKQVFYQELMAVSGTFASPENQGLIIDNSRLSNLDEVLPQAQDKLAKGRLIGVTKAGKINLRATKWTIAYSRWKRRIMIASSR